MPARKMVSLLTTLLVLAICTSCEVTEYGTVADNKALFLTTSGTAERTEWSRSVPSHEIKCSGNMTAQVEVSDWDAACTAVSRSAVSGDEVQWRNTNELGIYITDATSSDNALIARNLAMNPISHAMYETYYGKPEKDGAGKTVSSSKFFWNSEWGGKDKMTDKVNFYGFYPRPSNTVYQGALEYVRNSIILAEDAEGSSGERWNKLHYAFIDQTDDNMTWHDIMCSVPESGGIRYGNLDKHDGDNVQLHYRHMFSLLDIEVDKGDKYKGDCVISSLVLSGTQVFTEGTLDIANCTISPTRGSGDQEVKITRIFDAKQITQDSPFRTTMIVQPTQDGDNPNNDDRLIMTCCIDGVNYSCPFPTLKLESGKKYRLRLTLTPAGIIVFKIWDGATVTIGGQALGPEDSEKEITAGAETFTVSIGNDYRIVDILKNGQSIYEEGTTEYSLDKSDDSNTNYSIVTCKKDMWYVTNGMQLHYDGICNKYNGGGTQDKDVGIWCDLSGKGNDGTLRSFTATSGWNGSGLVFDGLDDIVYFSGKMTTSYTMEFYVCVEPTQRGAHPRFVAEGNRYPCFYFYGTGKSYNGTYTNTSHTRTIAFYDVPNKSLDTNIVTDGKSIIQLDFAYDAETKQMKWYVDGEHKGTRENVDVPLAVDIASIGNRYVDNSRAMAATYYSFIVYDRALEDGEVAKNHNVNLSRYGVEKQ